MQSANPKKTESEPKSKPKVWQLLLGLFMVAAGAWIIWATVSKSQSGPTAKIGNSTVNLEVADDPDEITQGLGGRDSIADDSGMLFILPQTIIPNFWMKDMKFPLDFVWIDEDQNIVAVTPSIGVDSYPITFSPPTPVKYVLEVNAGISAHNGWLPGDHVDLSL